MYTPTQKESDWYHNSKQLNAAPVRNSSRTNKLNKWYRPVQICRSAYSLSSTRQPKQTLRKFRTRTIPSRRGSSLCSETHIAHKICRNKREGRPSLSFVVCAVPLFNSLKIEDDSRKIVCWHALSSTALGKFLYFGV